jgi:hypothetical protein
LAWLGSWFSGDGLKKFATIISDRIHTEHRSIEAAATDASAGDVNRRLETVVA